MRNPSENIELRIQLGNGELEQQIDQLGQRGHRHPFRHCQAETVSRLAKKEQFMKALDAGVNALLDNPARSKRAQMDLCRESARRNFS